MTRVVESILKLETAANMPSTIPTHAYEVRPRKDHRGVDLISDALPFGGLWYSGPNAASNAIDHAKLYSRPALQMAVNDQ